MSTTVTAYGLTVQSYSHSMFRGIMQNETIVDARVVVSDERHADHARTHAMRFWIDRHNARRWTAYGEPKTGWAAGPRVIGHYTTRRDALVAIRGYAKARAFTEALDAREQRGEPRL